MDLPSLYRDLIEDSPDGIWVFDLEGRTLYANAAFARMYGVAHDQVTSVSAFDVLDETGKQQFTEHLQRINAGPMDDDDVEVLFHDIDGNETWISVRESLQQRDGEVTAVVHRIHSYDARRRVLDELRSSREALREAQDLARLGSWVYDIPTGRFTSLGGTPLVPGSSDDPEGPRLEDFLALVPDEDRERVRSYAEKTLATPGEFEIDVRIGDPDDRVDLRLRGAVVASDDGVPVHVTGTHQDVTEMRRVERALRDEVTQSALMRRVAAAANSSHSLREVLSSVRPLISDHDEWVSSTAFRLDDDGRLEPLDADVRAEVEALAASVVGSPAPVWSEDGRTIAFEVGTDDRTFGVGTITASRPPERRDLVETMVEAVSVQLARVAEREESARALAAARDAAMAASRQKSEFLTTMSHEIRTPLNGIIGLTDLLQRTALDPEQYRLTSGMQAAGHTLLSVLNDVLDFSKLDGREIELEHVDVDVRSLVDQVSRVLSGAARTGNVELVVWCEAPVPAVVLGDPTRMSQVLMNLVSNAVKFTADGEVVIRVSQLQDDGDRVLLRFEVTDTGIGIAEEHVERLFEPFTQADASTTRRFGGTGLGLSIAREVTSALGGELSYAPNPEGGSIFSFSVWCQRHPEGATDLDDYARSWLAGRRILVADGSPLRVPALLEQLHWWGMEVDVADDVEAANTLLARALEHELPYGAVLIDARLAGGGGMSLVADVAADSRYDRVAMVVVGSELELDLAQLREAGVSAFLDRPLSADALRATLLDQVVGVASQPTGRAEVVAHGAHLPRILVVEDNVVNQMVASGILVSLGYRPEIAQNGAEALEVLARQTFDAVLMDVQMPVLDGYAATKTLREREADDSHVPVIAMTAAAIEGERERCIAAGMDEFLTKPIDRSALSQVLSRWVVQPDDPGATPAPVADDAPVLPPTDPIPGLDTARLDMLRDLDPGDTTYIDRAIGNFQANSVAAVATIEGCVADGDLAGLKAASHKIAGSALNLGVHRAGEAARALELLANDQTTDGAEELLAELRDAMAEGRRLLLDYQATYSD